MWNSNFFIEESGFSDSDQKNRNEFSDIRIGKVSEYLFEKNPNLLPFEIKTPIVKELDYKSFLEQTKRELKFEDLPRFVKDEVYKAEQMKYYDTLFLDYLERRNISRKEYNLKNPKTKQDLFYDWLFLNSFDIGILNF